MKLIDHIQGNYRRYILAAFDVGCFCVINAFFYLISHLSILYDVVDKTSNFILNSVILLAAMFGMRALLGVYRTIWRYTSTSAYLKLVSADLIGAVITYLITIVIHSYRGMWQSMIVAALTAHACIIARLCYRMWYKSKNDRNVDRVRNNAAIVGAGQLGTYLANDLRTNTNSVFEPKFFIDHDRVKIGITVAGLKVYSEADAKQCIEKYDITDIIIAISDIDSDSISKLYHYYSELGCNVKIFESLVSQSGGNANKKAGIRDFSIEDLLFRQPIKLSDSGVLDFYAGKTVMVTGGGGSIGSELCRQIAVCDPKKLVIVDNYENNAYDIQQELIIKYGNSLCLDVEIASVQDADSLERVFDIHRPEVVFHAAAHKHVPLMEHSGYQAVKNNVLGTYNTANIAEKYGVKKFVLISTDKAVNPTNVMGATKRMCEMIVQCRRDSNTSFAAVRFGNVLGSNGSVIPLFKKQIAAGGPVTITDKRIIRYFMTIPEASQLVIRAGAMAKRGELFVLDMGKPVRIYDLAVNMIKLSGLKPDIDIPIVEVGLRPGEKLYEELLIRTEELDRTENDMIFVERDAPLTRAEVDEKINYLRACAADNSVDARTALTAVVPTFYDPNELNSKTEASREMQMV